MSDEALRASGAWMGPVPVGVTSDGIILLHEPEAPRVRPAVVAGLRYLFTVHDETERAKVRRERQTGIEEPDDAHAWFERVTVYAMRWATDAEIDAAMDGHEGVRYTA